MFVIFRARRANRAAQVIPHARLRLASAASTAWLCLWGATGLGCDVKRPTEPVIAAPHILFIGNSLTLHGPSDDIGWRGNWGMAASDSLTDYAHEFGQRFPAASLAQLNVSGLESAVAFNYEDVDAGLAAHPNIVVVELGDNAKSVATFAGNYRALLTRVLADSSVRVLCLTTWWNSPLVNAVIRATCTGPSATVVEISYLRDTIANRASSERAFASSAVGEHPGDRGMLRIADALYSAARR